MTTRERILDHIDDALFLEGPEFDEAILGVAYRFGMDPAVCYDRTVVIDILVRDSGMAREDAEEYFEINVIGAWLGDLTPVFVDTRLAE